MAGVAQTATTESIGGPGSGWLGILELTAIAVSINEREVARQFQ